ncbi:hypothetical protein, partial [Paracoccus jeotgali]|uniref:hypothetical protein n=1 Tax=Paracoccus jeotgali TaxID=2065379 RepID=UPI0028A6B2ED
MLALAGALPERWEPRLLFPDHATGRNFVDHAHAEGLDAATVAPDAWAAALDDAAVIHIHAGIGWEGHDLCALARRTGTSVVRTEHLPWVITCPGQKAAYAAMIADVDALITVSHAA